MVSVNWMWTVRNYLRMKWKLGCTVMSSRLSHWSNKQLAINCWWYHSAISFKKVRTLEQYIARDYNFFNTLPKFQNSFNQNQQFSGYFFKILIKLTYLSFLWILQEVCLKFNDNKPRFPRVSGYPWAVGQPSRFWIGEAINRLGMLRLGFVCQLTQMAAKFG